MDVGVSFGAWVKLRRRALRLTQEELARQVSCSSELIRKIEADARRLSITIAERLAVFLDLPDHRREIFVKVARAELRTDWLPHPGHRVAAPPVGASRVHRFNLPTPLTPLVGRASELTNLRACLERTDVRLLTLTGAPGIGKTRLAIQGAADIGDAFADGVCFVALAPVSDSTAVATAIAQALGIQERPGQPTVDNLRGYIRDRQLLLMLDNFEHLLAAAPLIADILIGAPAVKALVTSRAALRISGEQEFVVLPLALPDMSSLSAADVLAQYAAIDLFVQRARAIKSDFVLNDANAPAVAAICVQLDGLPLAIELAAARIKIFRPEVLLARLERRLTFLIVGPRDLPLRQQTLRSTIDWSYNLLSPDEQMLFMRLGIFVGGWTLEAAEAICDVRLTIDDLRLGDGAEQIVNRQSEIVNTLDGLAALVDNSLVRQEAGVDGAPRFMMLETLREYALERLEQSGEADALRRRHVEFYLALAEAAEPELHRADQLLWLSRLEADYSNMRSALAWCLDARACWAVDRSAAPTPSRSELGLRLAGALWWYWSEFTSRVEGRRWLTLALERDEQRNPRARAKALGGAAEIAHMQDDNETAVRWLEESLALCRALGDAQGEATALLRLTMTVRKEGEYEQASQFLMASMALYRRCDDRYGQAWVCFMRGLMAMDRTNYTRAQAQLEEAMRLFAQSGDWYTVGWIHYNLGQTARFADQLAAAATHYQECLRVLRTTHSFASVAEVSICLGHLARSRGDYDEALRIYQEQIVTLRDHGDRRHTADCLDGMAEIEGARGNGEWAARMIGAASALREAIGVPVSPAERHGYEQIIAHVRSALDEHTFTAAWRVGRNLSADQAVAEAIAVQAERYI